MTQKLIVAIEQARSCVIDKWGAFDSERDFRLQAGLTAGNLDQLALNLSNVCFENLTAAMLFRDAVKATGIPPTTCLFVHGSTGRGTGQVAPNIDFRLMKDAKSICMETHILPNCRDDVDLVLVIDDPVLWEERVREAVRSIARSGIPITLNLVSHISMAHELRDPDSPAVRRILLFNRPKWLIGEAPFHSLVETACAGRSWLDLPHEIDFKTLMHLAEILGRQGIEKYTFTSEELLLLFPTLFLSYRDSLHIGFPRERRKIHYDGVPSLSKLL